MVASQTTRLISHHFKNLTFNSKTMNLSQTTHPSQFLPCPQFADMTRTTFLIHYFKLLAVITLLSPSTHSIYRINNISTSVSSPGIKFWLLGHIPNQVTIANVLPSSMRYGRVPNHSPYLLHEHNHKGASIHCRHVPDYTAYSVCWSALRNPSLSSAHYGHVPNRFTVLSPLWTCPELHCSFTILATISNSSPKNGRVPNHTLFTQCKRL